MPLRDLRLDEQTWRSATPLRRMEWRAAIEGVVAEGRFGERFDDSYVLVTPGDGAITFEFLEEDGEVRAREVVQIEVLVAEVREYIEIIGRMDSDAGARDVNHLEALDMAKKVVHDKAARVLVGVYPDLAQDHATYRRIFTLVLAIHVDTTRMVHARGHRFVR